MFDPYVSCRPRSSTLSPALQAPARCLTIEAVFHLLFVDYRVSGRRLRSHGQLDHDTARHTTTMTRTGSFLLVRRSMTRHQLECVGPASAPRQTAGAADTSNRHARFRKSLFTTGPHLKLEARIVSANAGCSKLGAGGKVVLSGVKSN